MIKQWLAIFLLLAFSPSLHALSSAEATLAEYERSRLLFPQGVRSVGNGGGFGEMQAIFANLQLPSLLRTRLGSAPSLSPEIYKKIVEAVADDAPFAISPACGMAPIQFSMGKLLLGSCALYEVSDSSTVHVKDFAAIAAWVLAAKLMHRGAALLRALEISEVVFKGFSQQEEQTALSIEAGEFVFHHLQVGIIGQQIQVLLLEGRTQSFDLTRIAQMALGCGSEVSDWNLGRDRVDSSKPNRATIELSTEWTCDRKTYHGQLQVFFEGAGGEVRPESLSARVSGRY